MSTAGRPEASAPADSLAAAVREAGLVRLAATADGDALAALGTLARACRANGVPFQASVDRVPRVTGTDADVTVTVGTDAADVPGADGDELAGDGLSITDGPVSATAFAAARALDADPDPLLALAGAVAAGTVPGEDAAPFEAAEPALERRPGVAVPTADLADGLAHSGLVHAGVSGDPAAAGEVLAALDLPGAPSATELDADDHRRVASMVALRAVDGANERAAEAVERALRPYAGGPFESLGGYADVLDAVAREAPGTGVALALGRYVRESALDAWRDHGAAAHRAVAAAEPARHAGLLVVRTDGPPGTVARLLRDYRSPEPAVLVLADGTAALATVDRDAAAVLRRAAEDAGATTAGRDRRAYARNVTDEDAFVAAVREVVA